MNEFSSEPDPAPPMLPTTQAAEGVPRLAWSLEQLDRLSELGFFGEFDRVELIEGELVPMQAKGGRHENLKTKLLNWFARRLPEDVELSVELGWRPGGNTYLEPDIVLSRTGRSPSTIKPREMLLVIEVSDSSKKFDRGRKARLYAGLGVREYWSIDAATLETRIFREPTPEGYTSTNDQPPTATLTPLLVPALAIELRSLQLG